MVRHVGRGHQTLPHLQSLLRLPANLCKSNDVPVGKQITVMLVFKITAVPGLICSATACSLFFKTRRFFRTISKQENYRKMLSMFSCLGFFFNLVINFLWKETINLSFGCNDFFPRQISILKNIFWNNTYLEHMCQVSHFVSSWGEKRQGIEMCCLVLKRKGQE